MAEHILYSFRRCPYAMRARLALAISATRYEVREIRLSAKPAAFLEASPKGTVPVLRGGEGEVIDESLEIMRWALEANDPDGWLQRDDPEMIDRCDTMFKHHLDRYKYPERHGSDPLAHRDAGLSFLHELNSRLKNASNLRGEALGLADAAIMPFVRQFAAVDGNWFETQPLLALKTWLARHLASDLFDRVMFRVSPWAEGNLPLIVDGWHLARDE
ncbi:glutathione S-transferase [Sphingomonas sp.]|jgi:glutathione S-transferase|uniref:glutathione S-transferase n=1 Tax=Sphingomonas sp. TaxID=28214 RepID=UPI00260D2FCA|nr:glutathione S-transferase [Sphingomonas sp.]MDF2493389.1 hypothetical protein [Sphingomonas sp.]